MNTPVFLLVACACALLCCADAAQTLPLLTVPALQPGATIGLVSPAGCISDPSSFQATLDAQFAALGFKTKWSAYWSDCWGYLAGTDSERAQTINQMFADPTVDMVMATRGGWGCARIVELLDYGLIASNPKPFIGYSDVTSCLNAITQQTGMVTFHGPMGVSDWTPSSIDVYWVNQVLVQGQLATFKNSAGYTANLTTVNSGKARGRLIGGNLSVFAAITGSAFVPTSYNNTILFLEDTNEYSYSIDRMLTELQLAGVLEQISGFIWGTCTGCTDSGFTVLQVIQQHLQPLGVPAFSGFQYGHIDQQFTLPIGAMVEMDADAFTLTMLQQIVN